MRKLLVSVLIVLASLAQLAANSLFGFGLCFGGDIISAHSANALMTTDTTAATTGIGFNGDVYIGQKLGFYAGGAFGLITGINAKTRTSIISSTLTTSSETNAAMGDYDAKVFGNALLGLGAFFPLKSFDLSVAGGFGLDFATTKLRGVDQTDSFMSVGPGVSLSLGVPVSTNVEAYASCRLVYGLILLGDYPGGFTGDFSFTPAIGVRIKA